jgi:ATP-dependent RNA helicase SUPV3L1/SUV3
VLLAAANRGLRAGMGERVRSCEEAPDQAFSLSLEGQILWRGSAVGRLLPGDTTLAPHVEAVPSELLASSQREAVRRRLLAFVEATVRRTLGGLARLSEAPLQGAARGLAFTLIEGLGTVARRDVAEQVRDLGGGERRELSRLGITFSRSCVFLPSALRPEAVRTRAALAVCRHGRPAGPWPDGGPSLVAPSAASAFYAACGYLLAGPRYLRADVLVSFAAVMERAGARGPFRPDPTAVALLGCPPEDLPSILRALGFVERGGGFFAAGRNEGRGRTSEAQRA